MRDTSYATFWDTECIVIEERDGLFLIPKEKDDIKKINSHFNDQDFILRYNGTIGFSSIAFIERMQFQINDAIKLFPKYIINRCQVESFAGFEITGESLDDFFRPSSYFWNRKRSADISNIDFIYHSEIADKWIINFEGKPITVTLSFGDILRRGTASDLKLHPKLTIEFDQTEDVQLVYRIYTLVVRFMSLIRYDTKCGKLRIDLYDNKNGKRSSNGFLRDFSIDQDVFYEANHEVEYDYYKPYIQRFLQFAADNPNYTFYHYPTEGLRYRGVHYSAVDYMNIFSAFESECHAKEDWYENVDATKIQAIKESLIARFDDYPKIGLKEEEIDFLENARKRIMQLGTQFGQSKKIINAYQVLHKALDDSIEHIFYLPEFK